MSELTATAKSLVHASPSVVYAAFVDADTMSKFWFTRRDNGLSTGETVHWYVGNSADAYAITVRTKELVSPSKIVIEWGDGQIFTQVCWQIEVADNNTTRLTIEESGFSGTQDEMINRALDSTGGFNQVIIALKALLEHGAQINVVSDHI